MKEMIIKIKIIYIKNVRTSFGDVDIEVPRDRNLEFELKVSKNMKQCVMI